MRAALGLLALAAAASCTSSAYELPAESPDVRAMEHRLAGVVEPAARAELRSDAAGSCQLRLLGGDDITSYVWAECRFPIGSALSTPFRVTGEQAEAPRDGNEYASSVSRLFPRDLARAILSDPDRLRPNGD
jgi:hypothetical protein